MTKLQLKKDLSELDRLASEISNFARHHHFDSEASHDILLSLDELLTNIILHGMTHQPEPRIELAMNYRLGEFAATLRDNGAAFDPTQVTPPDLNAPIEQRASGGLGVFLARSKMDELTYQRDGDWNVLRLRKHLAPK